MKSNSSHIQASQEKKVFLVATPDETKKRAIQECCALEFPNVVVYTASDGQEALGKTHNVPPHVIMLDQNLHKIAGTQLAQQLIVSKTIHQQFSIVFLSSIPQAEMFVDEVAIGRVQFLEDVSDRKKLISTLFRALNAISKDFSADYQVKYVNQGDYLIRKGDKAEYVYILKKGRLEASSETDQKKTILGLIEPGEFVGELAYINGDARSADVVALDNCELIEIPINILDSLLFNKPSWSKAIMATLSKRVRVSNEDRLNKS